MVLWHFSSLYIYIHTLPFAIAIGPVYVFAELEIAPPHQSLSRQQCHHSKLTTKNHIWLCKLLYPCNETYSQANKESQKERRLHFMRKVLLGKNRTEQQKKRKKERTVHMFQRLSFCRLRLLNRCQRKYIHHFQLYKCTSFLSSVSFILYSWFRTKELFLVRLMHIIVCCIYYQVYAASTCWAIHRFWVVADT